MMQQSPSAGMLPSCKLLIGLVASPGVPPIMRLLETRGPDSLKA